MVINNDLIKETWGDNLIYHNRPEITLSNLKLTHSSENTLINHGLPFDINAVSMVFIPYTYLYPIQLSNTFYYMLGELRFSKNVHGLTFIIIEQNQDKIFILKRKIPSYGEEFTIDCLNKNIFSFLYFYTLYEIFLRKYGSYTSIMDNNLQASLRKDFDILIEEMIYCDSNAIQSEINIQEFQNKNIKMNFWRDSIIDIAMEYAEFSLVDNHNILY